MSLQQVLDVPLVGWAAPRREDFAQDAWILAALIAALIAGQQFYRLGRWKDGRFQYPRPATPLPITRTLPAWVTAVMLHGVDGSVRTLVLDLDTSKARQTVDDDDARRLGEILRSAGLAYVEDESPSGGRHLYVPLQQPLVAPEARQLVEALGRRTVSLDPSPHQIVVHGCIRVPESAHKAGGHQRLVTPLTDAYGMASILSSTPTHHRPARRNLRQPRRAVAAVCLALPLTLSAVACSNNEDEAGLAPDPTLTTIYEGSYTTAAAEDMIGNGIFTTPTDADRSDVESTAEVAALMLHSWDTTIDTTQTAAAIRAIPLMSNEWATNQVEPDRNGAQGEWLKPAENHAYSAPSIVPAPGDVSQDVADEKAIGAYDVSWRWISRDGTDLTTTGRQIVTIYLEKHDGQWDVVGHQFQDMSLWHLCAALLSPMDPSQRHADTPCEDFFQSDLQASWAAPEASSEKR